MMRLYIMRHGEARPVTHDPNRGLTEQGQADCLRMATFLQNSGVTVDEVCHSEKLRAKQTAEIMAKKLCPSGQCGQRDGLTPESSALVLAKKVMEFTRDTLIVSHLPLVAYLSANLLNVSEGGSMINFVPASIACLQRVDYYHWQFSWLLEPALLR